MPLLISRIARSSGDASRCSTIAAIAPSCADDAAVAVGSVDRGGQHRRRGAVARGASDQPVERLGPEQRHVARQQDHGPALACQRRLGLQQRVSGAELRLLDCKRRRVAGRPGAPSPARPRGRRRRRWMPGRSGSAARRTCSMRGRPQAGENLGERGLHPRALAGREDDDVQIGHQATATSVA